MLLDSSEFRNDLRYALNRSDEEIIILSAFMTKSALHWFLQECKSKSIKVVVRWQKNDLLTGASDFDCYNICREKNLEFGISLDLHGKVYLVDEHIFVGSSNLTSKGLGLTSNHNAEFGTGFKAGKADKEKLFSYMENVVWLDQKKAALIRDELDRSTISSSSFASGWPSEIKGMLSRENNHLWVHELPFITPDELLSFDPTISDHLQCIKLLDITEDELDLPTALNAFEESRSFKWLSNIIRKEEAISFGAVTAKLHHALLDDPKPYRKKVKILVSKLFAWFAFLEDYSVERPGYSQVIKVKDPL